MPKRVVVCKSNEMESGTIRKVRVGKKEIIVIRQAEHYYALIDRCSHEDYPLADGFLQDHVLSCPMHGAQFDIKSGEALSLPAFEDIDTFPVFEKDGDVYIELDERES